MKLLNKNPENTLATFTEQEEHARDEQDHLVVWEALSSLVPPEKKTDLVMACESVASYIKMQRAEAIAIADRHARVDEVDGLLDSLTSAYPLDELSQFSAQFREYRILEARFRQLNAGEAALQSVSGSHSLRPAA